MLGGQEDWPMGLRRTVDLLLETPQPSFIVWGPEQAVLFNGAFARWLGPDSAARLGAPFASLWRGAWPNVAPYFEGALEGRGVLAEDIALPDMLDGRDARRFATFSYTPVRRDDGSVVGVIGLCTDTTEKIRARAALEREHDRLVQLLEDAPGFVGKMSVPDFRFIAANRAYRGLVGNRDLIGRTIAEALPDLAEQGIVGLLEEVERSGAPFVGRAMALILKNPLGDEQRVIDVVCAPFKAADGTVEAILVAGHDVTEHVRSKERVEELQNELIHLSRVSAMGTMASTLGHELNQPLTAIVNYASVGSRSVPAEAPPQLGAAFEAISENALRAGRLIRSLRTMSRKGGTRYVPFEVAEAVNEAIKLSALSCRGQVALQVDPDLLAYGDRVQIEQILINLIRNACEAIADVGGGRVDVSAEDDGGKAVIRVLDNGPGIRLDPIDKVFAPFMSTKPDGIGIGLPISRTIAEAHGGRLWVENGADGGACFHLELPCYVPARLSGGEADNDKDGETRGARGSG